MNIEAYMYTGIKGIHGSVSQKSRAQEQLRRFGTSHTSLSQQQTGLYLHCKPLTHFFMESVFYTGSSLDIYIILESGENNAFF